MKWEVVIAGMALIVSIGVAIFSYVADRRGQHRQRFFEFSLFKMQSLEFAKKDISKIVSDLNRTINREGSKIRFAVSGVDLKPIFDLYAGSIDVFNSVRHNLDQEEADSFDRNIDQYEKSVLQGVRSGSLPEGEVEELVKQVMKRPREVEIMIDRAIKNLQDQMLAK